MTETRHWRDPLNAPPFARAAQQPRNRTLDECPHDGSAGSGETRAYNCVMSAAHRLRGVLLPIACLLAAAFAAGPQARAAAAGAPERLSDLLARMHASHTHSRWTQYRRESAELVRFLNGSPDAMLELARADARDGDSRAAIQRLRAIAQMGVTQANVAALRDFSSLRTRVAFRDILRHMSVNARPISHSQRAFVLADAGLLPEDLTY